MDREAIGWTIVGVAAIAGVYLLVNLGYQTNRNNVIKSQKIRLAKIEACKTIQDEALRTLCIVKGGAQESSE